MSEAYYPPGAFYFSVSVVGSGTPAAMMTAVDASFQEVSGMQAEFGIEEVAEGGENRFVHRLPKHAKYANLVLKRGVVTRDSFLAEWVGQTVGASLALPILTQNLLVSLLDADGNPTVVWGFWNAWPVRWETGPLDSMENRVLTEKLEFSYNRFDRLVLGSPLGAAVKIAQLVASMTRS